MKTTIKIATFILMTVFMSFGTSIWAVEVTPSVTLTTYYSAANGKTSDALRTALQGVISTHTTVSYDNLSYLMIYADTEDANGTTLIDIYSSCPVTLSGDKITWSSGTSTVGDGLNREHSVPQSWFNKAAPMVSDAFHVYPVDAKANGNRSDNLYGEFSGTGTQYTSQTCSELGKLSTSSTHSIAAYTYQGVTYSPSATYTGKVYEPDDEYKGDIARGYFYMATCYASACSSWSGGAFGSDNNGLANYTAELMLKWHRQDPVSEKELLRNEVIYGNKTYNKGTYKQGNRNPFIDYPELVEYIWGNKKGQNVSISALTSAYDGGCTGQLSKPAVTAIAGNGQITLTWTDISGADHYTVSIGAGIGFTTECSSPSIGTITHSGTTNTCVITGLINGLTYTTSVVANGTSTCDSDPDQDTTTPSALPAELTITFDANDGSQAPATKTQTVTYNVAATLDANTFSRTGYTFLGWNTNASATTSTYADGASVTFTEATTLYAVWQVNSHNVTYTVTPAGKATLQVNSSATTPQSFNYGTSVTVAITADDAYTITSVTATGVTLAGADGTRTFTMPDNDVAIAITLTAKPTHTVTWSANGNTTTATYYAGQAIVFPETAEGCDGKVFVGWSASAVALTDNAPEMVTSATMGDADLTYYAVFATETTTGGGGGTSSVVDELTRETTGVTGNSYSEWSGKTGTSGAVYAGQSAGGNSSIQLRSKNSNSGIVTTTSGGKATKVAVTWNDGNTIDIYGKNTAYTDATDLYGNNAGTKLGSIVNGTSTELSITGDYEYIGIRSNNGAVYLTTVSITWSTGSGGGSSTTTYSGYTTTCSAPTEVTVTFNANDGSQTPATTTQTIDYNTATALDANSFTRTGYTFIGWNTAADGSGTAYADEAQVTLTADITLYAQWGENYTIRFFDNGSQVGSDQTVVQGEQAVKPSAPTPCSTDYTFAGWWTAELAEDNTTAHTWITDFTATQDQDYYAVYSRSETSGESSGEETVEWSKATSIAAGDKVVLVCETATMELTSISSTSTKYGIGTTYTSTPAGTYLLDVVAGASEGTFAFKNGDNYLYWTSGNSLAVNATLSDKTSWKVTFADGDAEILNASDNARQIWWNNGSPRFACYTGKSGTDGYYTTQLYKQTISGGSSTTTYYSTSCDAVSEPVDVMLTVMLNGNYYAMTTALVSGATEIPAQPYFYESVDEEETYYYKDSEPSNITWRVATYKDSYLISNAQGKYLTINGEYITLGDEPFAWSKTNGGQFVTTSGTGLCYNADRKTFIVSDPSNSSSDTGISPSVTEVAVEDVTWQQASLYTRENLTQGNFATICLPFAVCQEFLDGVKTVYNVSSKVTQSGKLTSIVLMPETGLLLAGKPYVIEVEKSNQDKITLYAWYGQETSTAEVGRATGLVGNLTTIAVSVPANSYIMSNNQLRRVTEGSTATIGQYKAYFDLSDVDEGTTIPVAMNYKMMYITDNQDVQTGAEDTYGSPDAINWSEPVYNILGIQVNRNAKGVLIQQGIKYMIP